MYFKLFAIIIFHPSNLVCASNDAAEQKARATYDNILRLADDPDVREPIKFLREREIVHFQRFGEALRLVEDQLNNPSKTGCGCKGMFDK